MRSGSASRRRRPAPARLRRGLLAAHAALLRPARGTPPGTPWPDLTPDPRDYEPAVGATEKLIEEWDVVPIVGEFRAWARTGGSATSATARGSTRSKRAAGPGATGTSTRTPVPGGDDCWCDEKLSVAESTEVGVRRTNAYRALLRPFPRRYGGPLLRTKGTAAGGRRASGGRSRQAGPPRFRAGEPRGVSMRAAARAPRAPRRGGHGRRSRGHRHHRQPVVSAAALRSARSTCD